ncbi:MAG: InlB B-repeat-containing protein, partial [Oscillospiraceae bacterium]|nr:InlB B-repeat-containing protein [Oscillospiraceae bacterium]
MKFSFKRIVALALALAMILPFIPELDIRVGMEVNAATDKDMGQLNVPNLSVGTPEDATDSGTANWIATNANSFSASLQGKHTSKNYVIFVSHTYAASTTYVEITNNLSGEANLQFHYVVSTIDGSVTIGSDTLSGEGDYVAKMAAGSTLKLQLSVSERQKNSEDPNGASITVSGLQLFLDAQNQVTFTPAQSGGSFTVNGETISATTEKTAAATDKFTLVATPASGYSFAGWYSQEKGYLSSNLSYTTNFAESQTVTARFIPTADGIFGVGDARFTDLNAAAACAANGADKVIWLLKDATITGEYTIPAGVTLLIPYLGRNADNTADVAQTAPHFDNPKSQNVSDTSKGGDYNLRAAYRTLTLSSNTKINVSGNIEVGAMHQTTQGGQYYSGGTCGKYGCIKMNDNSEINLNNGANLYAWGYVIGQGTVNAAKGATIYEKMQVVDYRGGTISLKITTSNQGVFPFNQYYVQNVEVETVLEPGSALKVHTAVYLSGEEPKVAIVTFLGEGGMFATSGDTKLIKRYDPSEDRLILSAIGDGSGDMVTINGMNITLGEGLLKMTIDSEKYVLPINSNFTINIEGCTATVTQRMLLQPGARVHVAQNATLITQKDFYIFDIDQWGAYVFNGRREGVLQHVPGLGDKASSRKIDSDAYVDLNGLLLAGAPIYTTAGGACIVSSENTGVIKYNVAGPTANSEVKQYTGDNTITTLPAVPMWLTNGNGGFTETINATTSDLFVYDTLRQQWMKTTTTDLVLNFDLHGGDSDKFNPLTASVSANAGSSVVGMDTSKPTKTNATFLGWSLTENGEVLNIPANGIISLGATTTLHAIWQMNTVTITFLNWDGTEIKKVDVPYGEIPEPEVVPTKAEDDQYTYAFKGWDINGDGTADELVAVTAGATYKAVFEATTKTYTVTWMGADGQVYKTESVAYGGWVEGNVIPPKTGYTLIGWSLTKDGAVVEIPQVTGNVTYWPVYEPNTYTVTFKDVNGNVIESAGFGAEYNATPVINVTTSKNPDASNHYTFAGWDSNEDGKVDVVVGGTITVTGDVTLKPVFTSAGHNWGDGSVTTDPTCTTTGVKTYTCTCGQSKTETISATGHSYGDWVVTKDATCTEAGSKEQTCSACGDVKTEEIPATNHNIVNVEAKAPTCTEAGYEAYEYCTKCDHTTYVEIPATGHSYGDWVVTKDATCTETGSKEQTCSACGDVKTEVIPTVAHTPGKAVVENIKNGVVGGAAPEYDSVVYCTKCKTKLSSEHVT